MDSLNVKYYKSTGLHSHYVRNEVINGIEKRKLEYTQKYVSWLEDMIIQIQNCIDSTSIGSPLKTVEEIYKITKGE